jgi:hypothetical protein
VAELDALEKITNYMASKEGQEHMKIEFDRHAVEMETQREEQRKSQPATVGVMEDLIYEIKRLREALG